MWSMNWCIIRRSRNKSKMRVQECFGNRKNVGENFGGVYNPGEGLEGCNSGRHRTWSGRTRGGGYPSAAYDSA